MALILVFIVAMLVVPVMIDVDRHGSDNVLRRSVQDILRFEWVIALGVTARQIAIASLSFAVFGYATMKMAQYLIDAISALFR
jgi:hypothetical protein